MDVGTAVEISRAALIISLKIGAPVMLTAVAVGLLISILQAVTQLQDQTLSFVPKIIAMMLMLLFILPWSITQMIEYSTAIFQSAAVTL